MQGRNIGHGPERYKIEQSHQVWLVAILKVALASERPDQRDRQQKRYAHSSQVTMRCGQVVLIKPVGVDQGCSRGKVCSTFVMVDHYHIDPGLPRHSKGFVRHCTAINRDDEA